MSNIDLTDLVQAIIALAVALITGYLIPFIKSKTSAQNYAKLQNVVSTAVWAAEQLSRTGVIKKEEKKQYVLDVLNNHGFTLDYVQIEAMIESAVKLTQPSDQYNWSLSDYLSKSPNWATTDPSDTDEPASNELEPSIGSTGNSRTPV